jgi:hypothetical protein
MFRTWRACPQAALLPRRSALQSWHCLASPSNVVNVTTPAVYHLHNVRTPLMTRELSREQRVMSIRRCRARPVDELHAVTLRYRRTLMPTLRQPQQLSRMIFFSLLSQVRVCSPNVVAWRSTMVDTEYG